MSSSSPKRRGKRGDNADGAPAPHKLETAGLIVIAILILAITVLRYWHNINWRAR